MNIITRHNLNVLIHGKESGIPDKKLRPTSTILVCQVRKSPQVTESDAIPQG